MNKIGPLLTYVRIGMAALLLIFIIYLQIGGKTSNAEVTDVAAQVTAAVDMSSMQESTNRLFKKFYGLNANDYEGIALYSPVSNMDAEEILIVKLKSTSQADEVKEAIESRCQTQKDSFEGYGIEQYALLEDALIDVQGNYILYIVHADARAGDEAFRKSL